MLRINTSVYDLCLCSYELAKFLQIILFSLAVFLYGLKNNNKQNSHLHTNSNEIQTFVVLICVHIKYITTKSFVFRQKLVIDYFINCCNRFLFLQKLHQIK